MAKLIIHIGYPRTGSSTLQNLFKSLKEIKYIDITQEPWDLINHDLLYARENHLKRSLQIYRKKIREFVNSNGKNKTYFFSNETLTSSSCIFRFRPRPNIWTNDPMSIARKLSIFLSLDDIFDQVKILIGLREQSSLLASLYSQTYNLSYGFLGVTNSFEKFYNYTFFENDYGFCSDALYYDQIISEYIKIFKKENTIIYLLEEFQNNEFERLSQSLAKITNADPLFIKRYIRNSKVNELSPKIKKFKSSNRSITDYLAILHARFYPSLKGRWIQKTFFWKLLQKIRMPSGTKVIKLNESQIKFIQNKYLKSNIKLSEFINIDFKKYRYINKN